jgi:hypothetical protein
MDLLQLILLLAGLFLTLMILLYIFIGDNALFRLVTYVFVGAAAGYVAVTVIFQVLIPRLTSLLGTGSLAAIGLGLVPFVLGVLLLLKIFPGLSRLGTLPMALLAGVGAAVAVGGAIFGTIFGQVGGTISLFSPNQGGDPLTRLAEGVFVLIGTISTLAYFQFSARSRPATSEPETGARRSLLLELLAKVGQVFIGITLGAMFAGVYTAAISALVERVGFSFNTIVLLLRLLNPT